MHPLISAHMTSFLPGVFAMAVPFVPQSAGNQPQAVIDIVVNANPMPARNHIGMLDGETYLCGK
jgi:hypothetical protein